MERQTISKIAGFFFLFCACDEGERIGRASLADEESDAGPDDCSEGPFLAGGDGSSGDPYQIEWCCDLQAMENDLDAHYEIVGWPDCTGFDAGDSKGFRPVGTITTPFEGTLQGNGRAISGLAMDRPGDDYLGLFGVTDGATIAEFGLINGTSIEGDDYLGAVIGKAIDTSITHVHANAVIQADNHAGILFGALEDSTVLESYALGNSLCADQLCGYLAGEVTGTTTVTDSFAAGGIWDGVPSLYGPSPSVTTTESFFDCEYVSACSPSHPTKQSTANMEDPDFFIGRGWNYSTVWGVRNVGLDYPCFLWESLCDPYVSCGSDDTTCDGVDDDCDASFDEDYVSVPTSCGIGACEATGATSCVDGEAVDSCVPSTGAPDDTTCDFTDDDCDGSVDEDAPNAPLCLDSTPPTWPSGVLLFTASSDTQVTVYWSAAVDDSGVTAYRVFADGTLYSTVTAPTRTALVSGLVPGVPVALAVQAVDAFDNVSSDGPSRAFTPTVVPPDPSTLAPPLASTGVPPIHETVSFLFSGPDPIQRGVAGGAIVPERTAVLFGDVRSRGGGALAGVRVSVLGKPELGYTATRSDGRYDLVVSGGGVLTLVFEKAGFIRAQRTVRVPWQEHVPIDDVAMIAYDANVTRIDLTTATEIEVHRASVATDSDGSRQVTLLVKPGTTASLRMPDGTSIPLPTIDVRATEFTIGPDGPEAMPGVMPERIAYTYAVELSVDQAVAAGATSVEFSEPVPFYVENFVGMPVGVFVPVGYYDRANARWVPEVDGLVIEVLGSSGGLAQIDLDGNGVADSAAALADAGIDEDERAVLASLYAPGTELWRVDIPHFTPWDCNWPYGPPDDAPDPLAPDPDSTRVNTPCEESGSIIQCENQTLAEEIPILGAPLSLRYQSDRVRGRQDARRIRVPVASGTAPIAGLLNVRASVEVAGRLYEASGSLAGFASGGEYAFVADWDGRDRFGRTLRTDAMGEATLCYDYQARPLVNAASASLGGTTASGRGRSFGMRTAGSGGGTGLLVSTNRAEMQISLCRSTTFEVPGVRWDARSIGLGGFHLDAHHFASPSTGRFIGGDGRVASQVNSALFTVGGLGPATPAEGIAARNARIFPSAVAVAADGLVHFSNAFAVWRIDAAGILRRVAGTGVAPSSAASFIDGAVARDVPVAAVTDLAFGPDGSLYLLESAFRRVLRVAPDGRISRVVGRLDGTTGGTCSAGPHGDGQLAVNAALAGPTGIALDRDGTLYVADPAACAIRQVATDGYVTTRYRDVGSTLSPTNAIAVGPDGVYFGGSSLSARGVYQLGDDGSISLFAGSTGSSGSFDDGAAAMDSRNWWSDAVFGFDVTGRLLGGSVGGSMHVVDADQRSYRLGGQLGVSAPAGTVYAGQPARSAALPLIRDLIVGPNQELVLAVADQVIRVPPGASSALNYLDDDQRTVHTFDSRGQHLTTRDSFTGVTQLVFEYDAAGRLERVVDVHGNALTVTRPTTGQVVLTAPFGEQTFVFDDDGDGYSDRVEHGGDPVGAGFEFAYGTGVQEGLLLSFIDRTGVRQDFEYDALGRLAQDIGPGSRAQTLVLDPVQRSEETEASGATVAVQGYGVERTTAEERSHQYEVETRSNGEVRRSTTDANGFVSATTQHQARRETALYPNGLSLEQDYAPDARFGDQQLAPTQLAVETPGGRTLTRTYSRTVTRHATNPLALQRHEETGTQNGRTSTYVFDGAARTETVTSPAGRSVQALLNADGDVSRITGGGLHPLDFTYDGFGRLATVAHGTPSDERVTEWIYGVGAASRAYPEAIEMADGRVVSFGFDPLGRLTSVSEPGARVTTTAYDELARTVTVTTPRSTSHVFAYDEHGALIEYRPPALALTGNPSWAYDDDGLLSSRTLGDGRVVSITRDSGGRATAMELAAGDLTIGYSATTGQPDHFVMPSGSTVDVTYDGPLVLSQSFSGTVAGTITYGYDADFRPNSVTVGGTPANSIAYDVDGLVTSSGPLTFGHDPVSGLMTSTTCGSVSTTRDLSDFGELASLAHTWPGGGFSQTVTEVDPIGRVLEMIETSNGTSTTIEYDYDIVGRLETVGRDGVVTESYAHDINGNRSTWTNSAGSRTATYDVQDRVLTAGDLVYEHNGHGQWTEVSVPSTGETTSYDYDELGNLLSVERTGMPAIEYTVDAFGRRTGKRVGGTLQRGWLYHGREPAAELAADGSVRAVFIYGGHPYVPEAMRIGSDTYRLVLDRLGSVRRVVHATTGAVVQALEYDSYGRVLVDTNPGFQPFGYAGGLYDPDTGLVRFGARDYDASLGRWTSREPLLFGGGDTNFYAYVSGDPVNFTDSTGHDAEAVAATIFFGAVAALAGGMAMSFLLLNPGTAMAPDGPVDNADAPSELSSYGGMAIDAALSLLGEQVLSYLGKLAAPYLGRLLRFVPSGCSKTPIPETLPNSGPIPRSLGAASRAEMLAKRLKLNLNSPTTRQVLNSLDMRVTDFISEFRQGSIRSVFPSDFLEVSVEEALRRGGSTVRKLLIDGRFVK